MTAQILTQEKLKEHLHYCPDSGIFKWIKTTSNRVKLLSRAGAPDKKDGYRVLGFMGGLYREHHVVWLYVNGCLPKGHMDHINHDRSDNRISNLRLVSRIQNQQNTSLRSDNKSGVVGVSWDSAREKWAAQISIYGRPTSLGRYENKGDAIITRKYAELKHGYHANHGS